MVEDNEIYNTIILEHQLNSLILEKMKGQVEVLAKSRMELCHILKISNFRTEDLDNYAIEFINNIDINKSKIKIYKKKQLDLNNKINESKQECKQIKHHMNKLEIKLKQERRQSKKYNESLRVFLKREKFKFFKKIFFKSYRKVFLKYSSDLSIKTKIVQSNKIKENIRQEKQYDNNNIEKYKRKIIIDKVALAKMRKCIINMEKGIDFFYNRIQSINEHKEIENEFKIQVHLYKNTGI